MRAASAWVLRADPVVPGLEGLDLSGLDKRVDGTRLTAELGWRARRTYTEVMAQALAATKEIA